MKMPGRWYLPRGPHQINAKPTSQEDEDGLYQMCRNVRVSILSSLRIIANADMPQYPLNIHLQVDLLPQDIPNRLRIGRSGLARYLSIPIAEIHILPT
jgi:hypothetical protein